MINQDLLISAALIAGVKPHLVMAEDSSLLEVLSCNCAVKERLVLCYGICENGLYRHCLDRPCDLNVLLVMCFGKSCRTV